MIIQCEKCQTRFRLDDSRVTDRGVKVRCTKCKHVFKVQKEEQEAASVDVVTEQAEFSSPTAASGELRSIAESVTADSGAADATENYSSFSAPPFDPTFTPSVADDLDLEITGSENAQADAVESAAESGDVDFTDIDFGENVPEPDSTQISTLSVDDFTDTTIESEPVDVQKKITQSLDFSDDDMFGAVVESAPETAAGDISFDLEDGSFAESMDISGQDASGKSGALSSLDTPDDAPFSLSEIDFGDELTSVAVQQVNPEDLKPSQQILFAPIAEARDNSADEVSAHSFSFSNEDTAAEQQQELQPLLLASRRKQSPLFAVIITVAALLLVSALGYFGYSSFYSSKESASEENGKISVRSVKAVFVENDKVGKLLVITGEAFNEYLKPRAALQVKVTVFDSAGETVATKNAYGGNPLTEEQIKSLPLDKIEAAMANQFGDSLTNLEVIPNKGIPFVVVLANLPEGAADFAVDSSGSTVATGKQQ